MIRNACIFILSALLLLPSCQESLEDRCEREAREFTAKKCPAKISETTIVDSMVFDKSTLTMHYYYTMGGRGDDPEVIAEINPRETLLEEVRNNIALGRYKEAGYNFSYTYFSLKNFGQELFSVTFTPEDYNVPDSLMVIPETTDSIPAT